MDNQQHPFERESTFAHKTLCSSFHLTGQSRRITAVFFPLIHVPPASETPLQRNSLHQGRESADPRRPNLVHGMGVGLLLLTSRPLLPLPSAPSPARPAAETGQSVTNRQPGRSVSGSELRGTVVRVVPIRYGSRTSAVVDLDNGQILRLVRKASRPSCGRTS